MTSKVKLRFYSVIICITVALIFFCFGVNAQSSHLSAKIDSLLRPLVKDKNFSGTVLIAKNGNVEYEKAFGFADFEKSIPITADTKLCIGSISKSFTASAIMQLKEQGKLATGDKLSKYIPGFPSGDKITIMELLQHTSGIKREIIDDDEASKKHYSSSQIIDSIKKYPLDFEPGTRQSYSNAGYAVLARIVEIVSGESYEQYLNKHIFGPLKMDHSVAYSSLSPQKNMSKGYDPAPFPAGVEPTVYEDPSQNLGAGSIYSTVGDLLKWDRAVHGESILKKSTLDTMFKYGLGFGSYKRNGKNVVGHDGIVNGYFASMESFMDEGVCIIFLSNIRSGALNVLTQGLCDLYFNGATKKIVIESENQVKITPEGLKKFAGVYELFPGFNLTIKEEKGNLYLMGKGGYYTSLNSLAPDRFFYRSLFAEIDFKLTDTQSPGLIWKDAISGQEYPAKKIK